LISAAKICDENFEPAGASPCLPIASSPSSTHEHVPVQPPGASVVILLPLVVQPLLAATRALRRELAALAPAMPIVIFARAIRSAGRAHASTQRTAARHT
jgi:hypothetical protein